MDDKTMLEWAARACGYEFDSTAPFEIYMDGEWHEWNPLTDDGDALRLAVKLEIEPKFTSDTVQAVVVTDPDGDAWETCMAEEKIGRNKLSATRRAIVRAAAAIGKAMAEKGVG